MAVRKLTLPSRCALCPGVRLLLMKEKTSLWTATEQELPDYGLNELPYWAICWPGGAALAKYIYDNPQVRKWQNLPDFLFF